VKIVMGIYKTGRPKKYNPSTGTGCDPEHKPGEYRIRDKEGNITYVGETADIRRRMQQHLRSGKLPNDGSTFEYKEADGRSTSNTRRQHEQEKIKQHNPPLNKSVGGEGRVAKK